MTKQATAHEYPHMVIAWDVDWDKETPEFRYIRLLTPDEYQNQAGDVYPEWDMASTRYYSPPGSRQGPSEPSNESSMNKFGLCGVLMHVLSDYEAAIPLGVLQELRADLGRFRADGFNLDIGHAGPVCRSKMQDARYVF